MDCAYGSIWNSFGCSGGNADGAFHYYSYFEGITEPNYPYSSGSGGETHNCLYHETDFKSGVVVSSYEQVEENNVSQMKAALSKQPLSVVVQADTLVFQTYQSGVLDTPLCGK